MPTMPPAAPIDFTGLPGEALVREGLADLASGRESLASLLVQIGAPRLRLLAVPVAHRADDLTADRRLYAKLERIHGREAHSQFNSLVRQLVSFERALERRVWADRRATAAGPVG